MQKIPKVLKVAISVPNEAYIPCEAYDNHMVTMKHVGAIEERMRWEKRDPQYEFYWYTTGRLLTPMARETLIENAIAGHMDYIIMMDNDMIYPIDFIEAMLNDMEEHPEIDILAPLAFMRNAPHLAVMYEVKEGYDPVTHKPYFVNHFVKNYPKDKLVECDAVGFGAVCIKMSIINKMQKPYCFSTTGTGEDIFFCIKAKQDVNARIFMDTRIKLGHIGKAIIIDEAYRDKYIKDSKEEIEEVSHKYISIEK